MNTRSVRNFRPAPAVMAAVTVVIAASLLGGCTSHYKVTDPASGKVFYTTDIDRERSGVITFEDERTDADVTLKLLRSRSAMVTLALMAARLGDGQVDGDHLGSAEVLRLTHRPEALTVVAASGPT